MTGFNLPPGCEVHHIPGNRPEDIAEELFWEQVEATCAERGFEMPDVWDGQHDWLNVVREIAYTVGYNEAKCEADYERMEKEYEREAVRADDQRGRHEA